ncbi:hypothetical protein BDD12DRAFT_911333 [Trichophaea hybrida]|nr:hypothetical protein BDD12DRAFT_911333 [Trichophaea hybrida]
MSEKYNLTPPPTHEPEVFATRSNSFWLNDRCIKQYLLDNEPIYAKLYKLRQAGWGRKDGDEFFEKQRLRADTNRRPEQLRSQFNMFRNIALDMDKEAHVFTFKSLIPGEQIRILDTCMAPGGFSAAALQTHPTASVDGITLGIRDGGHSVHIPYNSMNSRVKVFFADVTMFATEFGVTPDMIPADHPDAAAFDHTRPYEGRAYDLIVCDGQVLRTHIRGPHREVGEATRLTNAQLILCLQRIKPRGTMVMLMHKMEAWDTVLLLRSLHKFAEISVYKPPKSHAIRSSFYIIAKNIRPYSAEAKAALKRFKSQWWQLTFGERPCRDEEGDAEGKVDEVIEEFGERLRELGKDIWSIQAEALAKAEFMRVD